MRPLLPGSASCAVLVTAPAAGCRIWPEAGSSILMSSTPTEAWDIFAGIIGPERAAAEAWRPPAIVRTACAGLPLAIRIAAGPGSRPAAGGPCGPSPCYRLADERRRTRLAADRGSGCAGLLRGQLRQPAPEWAARGSRPRVPGAGTVVGTRHRAAQRRPPCWDSRRTKPRTPSRCWSTRRVAAGSCARPLPGSRPAEDLRRRARAGPRNPEAVPGRRYPAAPHLVSVHGRGRGPDDRPAPLPDPAAVGRTTRPAARLRQRAGAH